ncbi:MAG: F0F1 ATP synthase subunit B [Sarcina sp.]
MEINLTKVLATIINFVILLLVLKHFFWNKVKTYIEEREALVLKKINDAKENEEKSKLLVLEKEKMLKEARIEGKRITEKRKNQADLIHDEIIHDAKIVAKSIQERTKLELEMEKQKAREDIKEEVVEIAMILSEKVLEETLDKDKHKEIIDKFINNIEV